MEETLADDAMWREAVGVLFALAAVVVAIGGLVSRVGGLWRLPDGIQWRLVQRGPWVQGEGIVDGGRQRLQGWVLFGRMRLVRREWGERHLRALGFSAEQAARVEGQITGHFNLRHHSRDELVGVFIGRSFSFAADGRPHGTLVAATQRRLQRVG